MKETPKTVHIPVKGLEMTRHQIIIWGLANSNIKYDSIELRQGVSVIEVQLKNEVEMLVAMAIVHGGKEYAKI